jgi:ectoine hydroxylase-related dioxygenase (phytanoyl-CoA dioxygenase family)
MVSSVDVSRYRDHGYCIVRGTVEQNLINQLLARFLDLVREEGGHEFDSAHSPEIAEFLTANRSVQARVYDKIRIGPSLADFSLQPRIVEAVRKLLGPDIVMMGKAPFRIDAPLETSELAVWHQDYFYVRGNEDIVTAWMPMQDVSFVNGCLGVMPGSHKLGPIEHDMTLLKKRHAPSGVYDREIRLAEMNKGDLLLFHSCLLHTSNMNLSNTIRFSLQARFARLSDPTDPSMGERISVDRRTPA